MSWMASVLFAVTMQRSQSRPRGSASGPLGPLLCQVSVAMTSKWRSLRRKRLSRNGAADGSKDPEKLVPDLEAAERRDGETRTTEKVQEQVSKEEQNSDDLPTPATAETEADQDVFIAPTLDFLTSKALSYSMNPVLLTSPTAREGHGKEELDVSFG